MTMWLPKLYTVFFNMHQVEMEFDNAPLYNLMEVRGSPEASLQILPKLEDLLIKQYNHLCLPHDLAFVEDLTFTKVDNYSNKTATIKLLVKDKSAKLANARLSFRVQR